MVLAHHVVFGAYGFWLPNDPRGSWSDFVGAWDLFRYGGATKTSSRASVAGIPHDRARRLAAKAALKYPAVEFSGIQARAVGTGFGDYARNSGLVIWACAILPDHVHLVFARHTLDAEQIVIQLKGQATVRLVAEGIHPFQHLRDNKGRRPKCFARVEWKVHLSSVDDILRAIRYVEENPLKEGKKRQAWSFVAPFTV
jgi:REP element-mobilizing transposase RayT